MTQGKDNKPPPVAPGEFAKFDKLFRGVVSVSNKAVREKMAAEKRGRQRQRRPRK